MIRIGGGGSYNVAEEAKALLAWVAEFPMSLVHVEENIFLITKTRLVRGGLMEVVAAFDEDDLVRLRGIVAAMKVRRATLRRR